MKIIKFLLKHIRRRIYLWKVDYIYNSCFVIEEGMPPSYYLTHTQEEICLLYTSDAADEL